MRPQRGNRTVWTLGRTQWHGVRRRPSVQQDQWAARHCDHGQRARRCLPSPARCHRPARVGGRNGPTQDLDPPACSFAAGCRPGHRCRDPFLETVPEPIRASLRRCVAAYRCEEDRPDPGRRRLASTRPIRIGSRRSSATTRSPTAAPASSQRPAPSSASGQRFIQPAHPRTNGKVERLNRTLATEWAYSRPWTSNTQRAAALPRWLDLPKTRGRRRDSRPGPAGADRRPATSRVRRELRSPDVRRRRRRSRRAPNG